MRYAQRENRAALPKYKEPPANTGWFTTTFSDLSLEDRSFKIRHVRTTLD